MSDMVLRQDVIDTACAMQASGLSPQRSGNVSVRSGDGFLITPTGMSYEDLTPEDVAYVAMDGSQPEDQRRPSSEWHMHQALFAARPQAQAVVHAHSAFAVSLACLREDIPPFHYMIAVAGGKDIRCADYATFGTEDLARNAVAAMTDRKACLLANHGQLVFGDSLTSALELAHEVEDLCAQYWRARQVGNPVILDDAEMERVIAKFAGYGQQPGEDA
ncbi:MAG: class II aldolase/adducin family protein [Alphaproteobacteria bacterium]|nr:class II aldolase/adducin family protein [Alphaproteobacteria bacterium]